MTYKKWSFIFLLVLVVFVFLNGVIWKTLTQDIFDDSTYYSGGLDRLGYIAESKHYRKSESTLPKRHIPNIKYSGQHIDILTIGDSFSNVVENGRDPLYQDWLASKNNLEVLNIQRLPETNFIETLVILNNSGFLSKINPRYVILETVERNCAREYAKDIDFTLKKSYADIEKYYKEKKFLFKLPKLGFINLANFKYLFYNSLRKLTGRDHVSQVYMRELDAPFFSVKNDRLLLFFQDDLTHMTDSNEKSIQKMNDNFNRLSDLLGSKGMRLFVMPAADKYNVYSDHILNNPYPRSSFFEILRTLPKRYRLIDTKALILEEIDKGEKDLYYADDTHWSWKASRKVAESVQFGETARFGR